MPTLSHLILYPIKSCAAMPVEEATATISGLSAHGVHDREWMLVTNEGQFLTQREFPRMATVNPRVEGDALVVNAPGMPPLSLPLRGSRRKAAQCASRSGTTWSMPTTAATPPPPGSATPWTRLAAWCASSRDAARPTSEKWTGGAPSAALFADAYPLLLIGQAALDEINARMLAAGRAPLPMDRFRPNLVVEGTDPFEEDYTASFQAGDILIAARETLRALPDSRHRPGHRDSRPRSARHPAILARQGDPGRRRLRRHELHRGRGGRGHPACGAAAGGQPVVLRLRSRGRA